MKRVLIILGIILIIAVGLIYYNKSYVDNYKFSLNGSDTILLNISDKWEDPLYTIDGNKEIDVKNNVDYTKEGNYQITYTLKIGLFTKTLARKVNIVSDNEKTDFTFTIDGDNPYYLMKNYEYKEPGYEAIDKTDGNITSNVLVNNNINNLEEGTYNVTYQIKNSEGITKNITRQVVVYSLKFSGKLKENNSAKDNEIIINITDDNYSYTLLPNNNKSTERNINYPVNENKLYSFKIYDKKDNFTTYEINVNNIDTSPPTGSCTLTLNDKNSIIEVSAKDNVKIKGYEYRYGNNKTNILESNTYTINTLDTKATVSVYDEVNNKADITCKTIDKLTTTTRSYKLLKFNGKEYWFYVPKGTTTHSKVPLVIYLHGGGITTVDKVNNYALPKHIKDGKSFPYYAAIPFYTSYNLSSTNDYVMKLIDYLVKEHNIDPDRIVISGGSNGSDPAYYIAAKNQKKFSAMLIIAGHSTISDLSKLTYLSVWFHQGEDSNYKNIINYASKLKSLGGNVKLTKYKGGHSAPNNAFSRKDVTDWIVSQKVKK